MSKKVIIIGSGIAGISSSLKLKSYGINSIIVDKGNFIGGRISTRGVNKDSSSSFFFHGAHFFTAKFLLNVQLFQVSRKDHISKWIFFFFSESNTSIAFPNLITKSVISLEIDFILATSDLSFKFIKGLICKHPTLA